MSSIAGACHLSARLTARSVRRKLPSRDFSKSVVRCAAQNFNLPSLSPTMTEGGIASWKVKEGDSFAAGDVLLEIETDKAQMDVEAQDDGKMFKIIQQDGAKGIKVGTRIAVLAEPGDDLGSLQVPEEEPSASPETKSEGKETSKASSSSSSSSQKQEESKPSPSPSPKQESSSSSSSTSPSARDKPSPQKYPLYPSVEHLLHTQGISSSDASSIPATGPNGRLLKGDVLAYLGRIEKSYSADQSARIAKLGHLDLSNIKKAAPKKPAATTTATTTAATITAESPMEIALPISLAAVLATQRRIQDSLGLTLPLSTFIARASEIANENLPVPYSQAPSAEALFDAVLGLDRVAGRRVPRTSRGRYVPQIKALGPVSSALPPRPRPAGGKKKAVDIIDMLAGPARGGTSRAVAPAAMPAAPGVAAGVGGANNVFSVSVGKGEERRARMYLERVKTVLEAEPGRCVL